ncbi:hypothetical protein POSPLADRAFT_1161078 [Postia placenta MAD-698-R-SB12]|uniref:Cytochrome P450 n=1 Tax=Postia placenta MAD-698-R-SB12 TaxID=670580 RepID=A0A1X6MI96_9APHY|nr:hypothetical protein POSPLADRAFT_1161078 [Postia placenta MAD-698-R-SB12]OSX56068.1 hypothetical protein POSPLADRAFT_1161078 [Postia placenta MAD-698-R-SB12]
MGTAVICLSFALVGCSLWYLHQTIRRRSVNSVLENIPGPPSASFLKGSLVPFFNRHAFEHQKEIFKNYGPTVKLHSFLNRPMLLVGDPKALHTMIIKEEHIFQESNVFILTNLLIFGQGLVSTLGEQHRKQRKILNPVFSVNHMRHMLPMFYNVIHKMRDAILDQVKGGSDQIDMLYWTGRAALELVGQGGLGYSFGSLASEMQDDYGDALKALLPTLVNIDLLQRLLPYVYGIGPAWLRRLAVDASPNTDVQKVKSVVDRMSKRSVEIYESKKGALEKGDDEVVQQIGEGKDIMSVLMKANKAASVEDCLTDEELIGQMSTLIFAATDTTSNALVHMLQFLADRQDWQDKLRQEILEAGAGTGIPYDEINKLPVLDAVCRETLRLFPANTTVMRVPNKDTVLPLSEPIRGLDGKMIHEIPVAKGTEVLVGMWACNVNVSIWGEDSLEWKPERWLSGLPNSVKNAAVPGVYSNLMTFLGGKRACIGFKFSEMEMKVVLSVLLSSFIFKPTGAPIVWNLGGVNYPTVGRESNTPRLPLKVEVYTGS